LGFACSANIGEQVAVFEPTHGSAPKYAGYEVSIVNPVAMIASACMILDHIGEDEISGRIRKAIAEVIIEGKVRTYDMMKMPGRPDVTERGAASTHDMAEAIIQRL
jgi:isocitrate/isopropylmalate dehydrogenase